MELANKIVGADEHAMQCALDGLRAENESLLDAAYCGREEIRSLREQLAVVARERDVVRLDVEVERAARAALDAELACEREKSASLKRDVNRAVDALAEATWGPKW